MTMTQSAVAVAPDPPPGTGAGGFVLSDTSPGLTIPDNTPTGVSRTIPVSAQAGTVRDVDVITNIVHQYNGELEIELTHTPPVGTPKTVRFVTSKVPNRSGAFAFNGTRWDDRALDIVSDAIEDNASGPQLNLVPEGAMASLIGRDPNGTWRLTVKDLNALDTGTLNGWTLDVKTSVPPTSATATQSFLGAGGAIPDAAGALVQTLQVSGANSYLTDLDLGTQISHALPGDLDVALTSPSGTRVIISNERPTTGLGSSVNALSTRWDDSAPIDLVRATFSPGSQHESMVPEGALGAFIGENPNGIWTISVADVAALDVGSLLSWSLNVTSTNGFPAPPLPPGPPTPGGGPACTKVNLATTILGAKRGERGDVARIKVKVANKTRTAGARSAKAVFKLPAGFTLAGKQKGIVLKRGKITATFGAIAGGKAKTMTIKLKAKAGAAFGLKKSSVAVTALCGSKAKAATIKLTVVRG
jgi:subtilisin-like proprotein convertase family protein